MQTFFSWEGIDSLTQFLNNLDPKDVHVLFIVWNRDPSVVPSELFLNTWKHISCYSMNWTKEKQQFTKKNSRCPVDYGRKKLLSTKLSTKLEAKDRPEKEILINIQTGTFTLKVLQTTLPQVVEERLLIRKILYQQKMAGMKNQSILSFPCRNLWDIEPIMLMLEQLALASPWYPSFEQMVVMRNHILHDEHEQLVT